MAVCYPCAICCTPLFPSTKPFTYGGGVLIACSKKHMKIVQSIAADEGVNAAVVQWVRDGKAYLAVSRGGDV